MLNTSQVQGYWNPCVTHVFLKTPPTEVPTSKQNCWEKNTQVISCNVEPVWHFRSRIVGPRKAMLSPKLKKTLQYVSVCWQFLLKSVNIRSSINIAWRSPDYPSFCIFDFLDGSRSVPGWFKSLAQMIQQIIECVIMSCIYIPLLLPLHEPLCMNVKLMPKNHHLNWALRNCQWFSVQRSVILMWDLDQNVIASTFQKKEPDVFEGLVCFCSS